MEIWFWIAIFIATILIEIFTDELVSIWFSIGSLASIIAYLCKGSFTLQIILFISISSILVISLRKIFVKLLKNNKEKTNLDLVIGSLHRLKKAVDSEQPGEIVINGVVWRVFSKNNEKIEENAIVKILSVEGNKFIVEKEKI